MMRIKMQKQVRNYSLFVVIIQFASVLLIAGCSGAGGTIAPVSGKVTMDGKPVAGLEVVFSPLAVEGNSSPGPWSNAVTDADGSFKLKTRHGKTGALIGKHEVIFEYPDLADEAELKANVKEAESKEEAAELRAALAELRKQLKERPRIPRSANREIEVPKEGIEPCNFELVSD